MSTDHRDDGGSAAGYRRAPSPSDDEAPVRFGEEHCPVYQDDICDGYGQDAFCDNCRYITDFVDWWSREAEELREFHALLHGSGQVSSA
jgi:hypothetical protein